MFHPVYEEIVKFASEGVLHAELVAAKAEFMQRTGELFESDPSFERRIAAFLEWYVFDRSLHAVIPKTTPLQRYIRVLPPDAYARCAPALEAFGQAWLSVFEFKKAVHEGFVLVDVFSQQKITVFERRRPVGFSLGDVFEARVVPYENKHTLTDAVMMYPSEAYPLISQAAKKFRKKYASAGASPTPEERIALVHQMTYLANKCERYKHVDPRAIFGALAV
jgi:hypothetical protein